MTHTVVAGGGTVGQRVAQALHAAGNTVVIVEADAGSAQQLTARGLQVITGSACLPRRLEAAGALHADVLVATRRTSRSARAQTASLAQLSAAPIRRYACERLAGACAYVHSLQQPPSVLEVVTGQSLKAMLTKLSPLSSRLRSRLCSNG